MWLARRGEAEREALLLWLPSALPILSSDALSYGYLELLLKGPFKWEALSVKQCAACQ